VYLRSIGHVEQQEFGGGGNPKFGCKMKDHQSGLRFHRERHVLTREEAVARNASAILPLNENDDPGDSVPQPRMFKVRFKVFENLFPGYSGGQVYKL
jgi:hypothetical protein